MRTALAALSVAGLIGLLAASGCINGVSVDSSPQDSAASAPPARAHKVAVQNIKPAIPVAGDVLIAGGADASNQSIAAAEFFDPSSGQFLPTGTAASSRAAAAAEALSPTQVLLAGGFSGTATIKNFSLDLEGSVLAGAETFDETTGAFSPVAEMTTPRMGFTATELNNGKVLVAGGLDNRDNVLDTAELYDPVARKFVAVAGAMSDRRMFDTATLLLSGKVLITGGAINLSGDTTNSADLYDPASNSFTPAIFPMDHQRAAHTATLFTTGPMAGKVLITGGVGGSSFFFKDSSAELYDPASQEFTLLPSFMNEPRSMHTATLLDDGDVLIAGGFSGTVAVTGGMLSGASGLISNSAETFDPNTGDFTCVGGFNNDTLRCNQSMTIARAAHTATLLATGPTPHRVLIAGGIGAADPAAHGVELNSAELFNPAGGGSFTATAAMSAAHALHTATLLH
ncbi:MAG: kelch repeat-containing protein [Candidatus Binatus sp.]|uniref:Kelch repeat-containing protein n=1 Tax=Candidatus Binatus sp. TaxID=2811406 RepID=UPI003C78383E